MKKPTIVTAKPTPRKGAAALAPRAGAEMPTGPLAPKPTTVKTRTVGKLIGDPLDPVSSIRQVQLSPTELIFQNVSGPDSIEDAFRQTGRTTRMLEAAAEASHGGTPVLIIVKDEARVAQVKKRAMFYPATTVHVFSHNPANPLFSWETLAAHPKHPEYADWKIFIDHDVIFSYHRHLFKLMGWEATGATNAG